MAREKYLLVDQGLVCREEEEGEALLFNPDTGEIKVANPTASFIWQLCDGTRTKADVLRALEGEFENVGRDVLERDLDAFFEDLENEGLISYVEK
jgi:hypothetical protein